MLTQNIKKSLTLKIFLQYLFIQCDQFSPIREQMADTYSFFFFFVNQILINHSILIPERINNMTQFFVANQIHTAAAQPCYSDCQMNDSNESVLLGESKL